MKPAEPKPAAPPAPSRDDRIEQRLDEALEETFPASDPPAPTAPGAACP